MQSGNRLSITQSVVTEMERDRDLVHQVTPRGKFFAQLFDKEGTLKWEGELHNAVTNEGKNHWLGVQFHGDTQVTTWYIGLIDNSGWTAEAASDTLASHTGWSEFTSYSGNRQSWGPGASASQSITNSTPVQFTMTGSGTLKGIFVASVATGTSGKLWATADFGSTIPVSTSDVLKVTYTVNS